MALSRLKAIDKTSGRANAVIDTPRGSRAKYKYDEETGLFRLHKLLPLGMHFPYNFGFIPSTRGQDGDALDVLILMEEPAAIGSVVPVRLIGGLAAQQTEKGHTDRNDRLLGVLETEYNRPEIMSLDALDKQQLHEIEQFFVYYNRMEGRRFEPAGRYGPDQASALVEKHGVPTETA